MKKARPVKVGSDYVLPNMLTGSMYVISYNTGKSALPDIYKMPEDVQYPRADACISSIARVPVL